MSPGRGRRAPVLLVVGSGESWYREYLLAGAAALHDLWLFESGDLDWQLAHVVGADQVELGDEDALLATTNALSHSHPVAGVVCWDEALVLHAARLAERIGVRGPSYGAVQRCRDKALTRSTLAAAGIAQPESVPVASVGEAAREANRIGYPVVLKPRALGASQGVVRVDRPEQLALAYHDAASASHPLVARLERGVLVEEYVDGPEISVDAAVVDGRVIPLTLARKELGLAPYFEEVGHLVDGEDPLLEDPQLLQLLLDVHVALGVDQTITHTEVRLANNGSRVIEVNCRLGGDRIPYLGWLARGIDHGIVAAQVALGQRLSATPTRHRSAGIRFGYPEEDCVVRTVHLPATDHALIIADALAEPGQTLHVPPTEYALRYGAVICVADRSEDCRRRLATAAAALRLDSDPLSPVPTMEVGGWTNL